MSVFLVMALAPDMAFAASGVTTLGGVICKIKDNVGVYGDFISAVMYVAGAYFIGNGVMMLKQHYDAPGQVPLQKCMMSLIGGAACLALPEVAYIVQVSVTGGRSGSSNGASTCSPGAVTNISSGSLDAVFTNFTNNIASPMQTMLSVVCLVTGALLVAKGLLLASKYGSDARSSSFSTILSNLVVGAVLLSVGQMADIVMNSVFGVTASSITTFPTINWSTLSSSVSADTQKKATLAVNAVLTLVQILGLIAFIRGWLVLKAVGEGSGQATVPQALSFIIGGVMCINIGGMAVILNNTFGLNVVTGS